MNNALRRSLTTALFSMFFCFTADASDMVIQSVGNGGNCNTCGWIMAQGEITAETPKLFERLVASGEITPTYVRIHSPGGDLNGALELGRLFRKHRTTVEVGRSVQRDENWWSEEDGGGECLSACAYAFLGGHFRDISSDGKLGYHQFYDRDVISNLAEAAFTGAERLRDQYVVGVIINYLIEMGISTELYPLIAATEPGDMRILTREDAMRLRIHNIEDPVSEWRLLPFGNGLVSEVGYATSDTRVRLYCSGKKQHLTYIFRNETPGKDADWLSSVTPFFNSLLSSDGKQKWPAKFNQIAYDSKKTTLFFVFDIPQEAAKAMADASFFSIESTLGLPRAVEGFFRGLAVGLIAGDKRMPKLALKNCV